MSEPQIALVTGAGKGIGFETARQLGKLGFTVLLGVRNEEHGRGAVQKLTHEGIRGHLVKLDTTSAKDRDACFGFIEEKFGKLDVLINNAAIALDRGIAPSDISEEVLRETFEVNLFAVVALTKRLLPLIKKSRAGRI